MTFKSLPIILSLPFVSISFSHGKNVFSENGRAITISGLFNRAGNTGYSDSARPSVPVSDTDNYYTQRVDVLPPAVLLDMPVPGDQGKQPSCSAWAIVYGAGNYYMHQTTGKPYGDSENLSPAFIYNQLPKGSGGITALIDNLELFKAEGACSLKCMPYYADNYSAQPDSNQRLDAAKNKIKGWGKIDPHNLLLLKKTVFQKKPVIIFIATDEGFNKITPPFIWKDRCGTLGPVHAMVIAGYDDSRNAFLIMNSWGTSWGDKGFVWIDYRFFLKNTSPNGYILM